MVLDDNLTNENRNLSVDTIQHIEKYPFVHSEREVYEYFLRHHSSFVLREVRIYFEDIDCIFYSLDCASLFYRVYYGSNLFNIYKQLCKSLSYKFNLLVDLVHENTITGEIRDVAFKTTNVVCFLTSNLLELLRNMFDKLLNEQETFTLKRSSWRQISLDGLQLRTNKQLQTLKITTINVLNMQFYQNLTEKKIKTILVINFI
ncbi:Uncharacterized protein FWK35_00021729 [Aphis craccivora]|uniref:Uncharacterized protein n=1 Tax=Aphis craccivora TaxID=307492 RepID=A0A6G0YDY0_APHCR|nr:Uncharacterized protein FWK35_00021729 [Aphis craccivora]